MTRPTVAWLMVGKMDGLSAAFGQPLATHSNNADDASNGGERRLMRLSCQCSIRSASPLHVVFAVRSAEPDSLPRLREAVTRALSGQACARRSQDGRVLALVPVRTSADDAAVATRVEDWHRHVSLLVGPVSAGRSAPHAGQAGVQQGLDEALRAMALGERLRGPGHLTAYGDVFVVDYAERLIEDNCLGGVYEQVLSRLGAFDQSEGAELMPTLEVFLANGCSTQQTASGMGIHRNTVLYRLKRMQELTRLDLTNLEARFFIQLALRAHRRMADGRLARGGRGGEPARRAAGRGGVTPPGLPAAAGLERSPPAAYPVHQVSW